MKKLAGSLAAMVLAACGTPNSGEGGMAPVHPYDYMWGKDNAELKSHFAALGMQIDKEETAYYAATKDDERARRRNNILAMLRTPMDEFWRRYQSKFYGNNAYLQTTFEATTGTLSAAAAITSPIGAKSILAALSTAVGALGTSYDKNVLQQQTTTAVLHQMEADVTLYGERMSQGMRKPDSEYPLAQGYADLQTYARAMSVPHALASMNAAAGAQLVKIKDDVQAEVKTQAAKDRTSLGATMGKAPTAPRLVPADPAHE